VLAALDFTISSPSGITRNILYELYDATNAWNWQIWVAEVESDFTSDQVTGAFTYDAGTDFDVAIAIVDNAILDLVAVDAAQDDTGSATEITVGANLTGKQLGAAFAIILNGSTTTYPAADVTPWNVVSEELSDGTGDTLRTAMLSNAEVQSGPMTVTFSGYPGTDLSAVMLLFNKFGGSSGLFMGQDF
jgi:hypothetical protein